MTERHHPEGRWGPGKPYISDWTIPLTKDQHDRIHVALRAKGLDFPPPRTYMPENLAEYEPYMLRRLRLHVEILADQ
jgi:hypothetical protein